MSIIRDFIDENTGLPSSINGCDDASITALRSLSGMTNETSTFPAARFRPAPVLMLRHVRDNPRPAVVSAGAASPLATPRSTCVPRSSHRSRDRAAHRDAASEVVPRATRETRTSPMRGFSRPFASQKDVRNSQIGRFRRAMYFLYFSLTSNSPPTPLRRFPFLAPRSRLHLRPLH